MGEWHYTFAIAGHRVSGDKGETIGYAESEDEARELIRFHNADIDKLNGLLLSIHQGDAAGHDNVGAYLREQGLLHD